MKNMPRKAAAPKTTKPAKKVAAKVAAPKSTVAPTKKERMAMANPHKTWANVQETEMKSRSWADWTRDQLDKFKL